MDLQLKDRVYVVTGGARGLGRATAEVLVADGAKVVISGRNADSLAEASELVSVLHRQRKEGLGPAYLAGFHVALDGGAERIIEMDADFSHDPAYLPVLIEATEEAVYNSLFQATTVRSASGSAEAIPVDRVLDLVKK